MANEIPDLDGVEAAEASAPQAPPGRFLLVVTHAEESESEAKNKQHWYTFSVIGGPHHGKVAKQNFNIGHDFGKQIYKGFLVALGFKVFKGLLLENTKGKILMGTVVEEEYTIKQGKNAGKKAKSAKVIEFADGSEEFKKFMAGSAAPAAAGEPAGATAGQSEKQLGF